ncbi:hypothetical protein [Streptomyces sp. SID1121]|uniref:hypothetical protein n=1 Tax=Streptomyces sp. SID1121 TaxID=3425888 RepID=UPI004055FEAB
MFRLDLVDVAHRPVELALALAGRELALRGVRELVDHGVPDRAGELREVRVHLAELADGGDGERVGVVLVELHGLTVVE